MIWSLYSLLTLILMTQCVGWGLVYVERHCLNPKFGANSLLRPELSPAAGPGPLLAWRRHGAVFDNVEYSIHTGPIKTPSCIYHETSYTKLAIAKLWKWRQQLPELLLGWSKLQQTKQFFLMGFRPATSYSRAAVLWSVSKVRNLKKFAININFVLWQIHYILWSPLK